MPKCATCKSQLPFKSLKQDDYHFCDKDCLREGYLAPIIARLPKEVTMNGVLDIHQGLCPKCKGPGPIDIHTAFYIWSLVYFSDSYSKKLPLCKKCGVVMRIEATLFSGLVGWWSILGFLATPVKILRNIYGLLSLPNPEHPSEQLVMYVNDELALQLLADRKKR